MSLSNDQKKDGFVSWQKNATGKGSFSRDLNAEHNAPPENQKPDNFRPLYKHTPETETTSDFTPFSTLNQPKEERPKKKTPAQQNKAAEAAPDQAKPQKAKTAEFQKSFEQGKKEGFAKGEKEGYEAGLKKAEEMVAHLENLLSQVDGLWEKMVRTHEKQIIQLVGRAAEQVVYGIVDTDLEVVKRSVLNAFEKIPEAVEAVIQINPDDYDLIEAVKDDIFEHIKALQNISVISNPSISRSGCKIETTVGEIDSSIEGRLEDIKKNIIEAYNQKAAAFI